MDLGELPTPCLLLDRGRLERNAHRMRAIADAHGVSLRPHLKTSKSLPIAAIALGSASSRGATVSTLEEAGYFIEAGLTELVYAVGVTPSKLERVSALQAGGATLGVLTDAPEVAGAIVARADALGARFSVWIEVDCGQHRGGVGPEDEALMAIGRTLASSDRVALAGVLTHAGHAYGVRGAVALQAVAEEERAAAVRAAERLRAGGLPCPAVSVGSTPTATHARHLEGVTELRAGVYVFQDLFQLGLGTCSREDLALTVLASVVGRRPDAAWVDAGALALSQDHGLEGYGEVVGLELEPLAGSPRVDVLNQVHGRVVARVPPLAGLEVGARVRILPNHACHAAAMFDRYYVLEEGRVVAEWPRLRG